MSEYPKLLWLPDGREITVADAVEEARKRAEGCVGHGEPDESDNEPTFGPPDDDTHTKRSKKKK